MISAARVLLSMCALHLVYGNIFDQTRDQHGDYGLYSEVPNCMLSVDLGKSGVQEVSVPAIIHRMV